MKTKSQIIIGIILLVAVTLVLSLPYLNMSKIEYYKADYPSYDSQSDMENVADIVIEGKVINSQIQIINVGQPLTSEDPKKNPSKDGKVTKEEGDIVYTVSKVKVNEVYKGQNNIKPGDIIEVKQLGGTMNNVTYKDKHTKPFENEKEYVMFLKDFQDGIPFSLINSTQGSYEKKENQYMGNSENKVKLDIESLKKINNSTIEE